ncbi:glycoside hydrolase [Kovacikia minuta CCNUW1]|uniref:glycoside hydrolase n=1 Tax=Kovacikia minuta TaxID=2931930 RepID=UPI001CCAB20D|nr:glycoside hydrolase [Kovacikia minuta]UBF28583.1 glycoside hydrolase [Kovacikia minuta CCNUW1]
MSQTPERLYNLLPAIYRVRDGEQGGQLRAFLSIIESELNLIEADIDQLYDNWFIETCDEWVVPYIGDLMAVKDLNAASPRTYGQERRAYVANTLAYRQRKGTTPVLEQLARDITGWGARIVEALPLLATTQNLNHPRYQSITADLRSSRQPERLGTPFEQRAAYTTELPRLTGDRGRYNPASLSLFLWRLQSYPLHRGTARAIPGPKPNPKGRYFTFNCLGYDAPLFNQPQTETEITTLAAEINLPAVLTRRLLANELTQRWEGEVLPNQGYFGNQPVLQIWEWCKGKHSCILSENILIGDLRWEGNPNWKLPPINPNTVRVVVDPETGRLAFLTAPLPDRVEVSYSYGFSGDIGGGSYDRPPATPEEIEGGKRLSDIPPVARWLRTVSLDAQDQRQAAANLHTAIRTWNQMAQSLQHCSDSLYIPLARLVVSSQGEGEPAKATDPNDPMELSPRFKPGVVAGLTVLAQVGDREVVVMPGLAVDTEGQPIVLRWRYRLNLRRYRKQWVTLAIVPFAPKSTVLPTSCDPLGRIRVVPDPSSDQDALTTPISSQLSTETFASLPLIRLHIDATGQIAEIDADDPAFEPGIVQGLMVEKDPATGQFSVSKGVAVNGEGQRISLGSTSVSLTKNCGQRVLVYLTPTSEPETGKLGVVQDAEMGCISLHGNQTCRGNFTIQVPSGRGFQLVAGNGDRPHLRGNLAVRGIATTDDDPGEFSMEGVLLEGKLTVLPGSLQRLQIFHCTLVPLAGGLVVEKAPLPEEDIQTLTLVTLILYLITLIQQFLKLGFGDSSLPPQKRFSRLMRLGSREFQGLFDLMLLALQQCQVPEEEGEDEAGEKGEDEVGAWGTGNGVENNERLQVTIRRSIVGAIALADTVPSLKVVDSVVDNGVEQPGVEAIAAIGTAVELETTTVLGTTVVRSLEASNSLLTEKVTALRLQAGCLRFCYVPAGSRVARRYHCQPDLTLAERIDHSPAPITALSINPVTQQVWVGTAGQGTFQLIHREERWIPFGAGLTDLNVTALLAAPNPDNETLLAGTLGGTLFQLKPFDKPGLGILSGTGEGGDRARVVGCGTRFDPFLLNGKIQVGDQVRQITAVLSDGLLEVESGFNPDFSTAEYLIQTVDSNIFQAGDGTVSSCRDRATLTGCGTQFMQEVRVSDILSVAGQSFTVIDCTTDTSLRVSPAPTEDISGAPFRIRRQQWTPTLTPSLKLSTGTVTLDAQALAIHPVTGQLFLGTSGGVFHSIDGGQTWTAQHLTPQAIAQSGLSHPQITALTIDPHTHRLFAGTAGGGIFRSADDGNTWRDMNQGLNDLHVTALTDYAQSGRGMITTDDIEVTGNGTRFTQELSIGDAIVVNGQPRTVTAIASDTQLTVHRTFEPEFPQLTHFGITTLMVGTRNGTLFRSKNGGKTWQRSNTSLGDTTITALATWIKPGIGTLSTTSTSVMGVGTAFTTDLTVGSTLQVADQTRQITAIASDTSLTIDAPFSQDFPIGTTFAIPSILVGTQIGNLFYTAILPGVQPPNASATSPNPTPNSLWLSQRWRSLNSGLGQVDETLILLSQMQPAFTSKDYGQPGYAQLKPTTPIEIRAGAEDGSEMGAFNYLKQPQREANLRASLDEYLRFGIQVGIEYIT